MSEMEASEIGRLREEAKSALSAAEAAWLSQEPARLSAVLQGCDRVLKALPEESAMEGGAPDVAGDALAAERAALWLWRGRLLVIADKPEAVVQGLQSLDQSIARLRLAGDRPGARAELAVAWMNRGSGLFQLRARDALAEAVRSYDQAIELMGDAPEGARNALGAAWMNRGVGLLHLDIPQEPDESVEARLKDAALSFEKAIGILAPLAATQRAALRNLASAWSNLGMLHSRRNEAEAAVVAHGQAVTLFRSLAPDGGEGGAFELAARLYNLGQACGAAGKTDDALAAAREALAIAGSRGGEPHASELALRSRHALCVVMGGLLAAGPKGGAERSERLAEAGDLVEDGLAGLAARGQAASPGERAAGLRLFEFGAWLYRTQQPRFLGEFLLEHMGEDPARAQAAAAAVRAARQDFVQRSFSDTTHGGMDRLMEALEDIAAVEARLKALASAGAPA